jgi:hypothetical protein
MKVRVLLYCLLGGLPMLLAAMGGGGSFAQAWFAGVVMAAGFVPLAVFGPRGFARQAAVILPVFITVTWVCTWTEALVFMPSSLGPRPLASLLGSLFLWVVLGLLLALLAAQLKTTREGEMHIPRRTLASSLVMVLLCGAAYAFYYLVTGSITYQYFTKGYYPEAQRIAQSLGLWFWAMQIVRGVTMTLGVLPAIHALRMPRWQAAIAIGSLIWITGGLAPLLLPAVPMVAAQRIIHIVEIFSQNFPLGVTAVLVLRPKMAAA